MTPLQGRAYRKEIDALQQWRRRSQVVDAYCAQVDLQDRDLVEAEYRLLQRAMETTLGRAGGAETLTEASAA
jgi:hypothetical protein